MRSGSRIGIGIVVLSLAAGGAARADNKLFASVKQGDPDAVKVVRAVIATCVAYESERGGPSRSERRKCDKADQQVVALGPRAAAAALKALDESEYPFELSFRMYGIVGRAGDLTMVEPLVAAIEKMDGVRSRRIELPTLESALSDLTYAPIGQRAPWQDWEEPGRKRVATEATAWRAFMTAHPTLDRAALLAERLTDARAHVTDTDVTRAYFSALFLTKSSDTQEEGRRALQALLERKRLPPGAREEIREVLRRLKGERSRSLPKPVEDPKTLRS